jgi:ATP-dependent protease ClpP protease subunit
MSGRPNREAAVRVLGQMRRLYAEDVLSRVKAVCRERGCEFTEHVDIFGILSANAERDLRAAINRTWGCSTLKIAFNSPGGSASVGVRIADDLAELRRAGVRIECHAVRQCSSAAVLAYAQGNLRTACTEAQFTLHQRSLTADHATSLKPNLLRALAAEMAASDEAELKMFRSRGVQLPSAWEAAFRLGEDVELSALDAYRIGLVHAIR